MKTNFIYFFYYSWLARTNPKDVARVESRTFMCTKDKYETVPHTQNGVKCTLGNWISYQDYNKAIQERFPNCMKGIHFLDLKTFLAI